MVYTGVDACRTGWFVVMLGEGHNWRVAIFPDIFNLWKHCQESKLILIDIPIGLRQGSSGQRVCDQEARRLLGGRRSSSVFPVPCREVIHAGTEKANELSWKITGKGLSRQSLNIINKIKQVDELLLSDRNARSRILETHPELCFWALNDGVPMKYSKKKREGFLERMEVLHSFYPYARGLIHYAERSYPRGELARDDILDALVAAVTASKEGQGLSFLPEKLTLDARGLPMCMAYYLR
jgi:predicted RNase H-like nuclease